MRDCIGLLFNEMVNIAPDAVWNSRGVERGLALLELEDHVGCRGAPDPGRDQQRPQRGLYLSCSAAASGESAAEPVWGIASTCLTRRGRRQECN